MGWYNSINKKEKVSIRNFKFLSDDEPLDFEEWDGATWSYVRLENLNQYNYDVMVENHYGIRSFLNNFPNNFIVSVLSITGPNGVVHTIDNQDTGWGFNILSDLITVQWVRYLD